MAPLIDIDSLWKVFGERPELALEELLNGADEDELHARTGARAAVRDVSLSIEADRMAALRWPSTQCTTSPSMET
ncbi:MAG: hypothetical protein AB8B70_07100 [Prochlorococcus sp.]